MATTSVAMTMSLASVDGRDVCDGKVVEGVVLSPDRITWLMLERFWWRWFVYLLYERKYLFAFDVLGLGLA